MGYLKNISDKDRRVLIPAAVVTAFAAILLFVDLPLYRTGIEKGQKALEEEKRLNSIIKMGKEHISIKYEIDDIKDTAFIGEGSSLSGLDSLIKGSGLKKKLITLKPTSTLVSEGLKKIKMELTLEKMALADLFRILTAIESDGHPIEVERISIKAAYDDPSMFNSTLVLNTVEKD